MRLGMRLRNLLMLVLRLEVCLLQAKDLCSGLDIKLQSTLLRLGLGNKSEARPSVFCGDDGFAIINAFLGGKSYKPEIILV